MRVDSLQLENFRNISTISLDFHPELNLIYGKNAQGKTSLVESLVYLSTGSSHRASLDKEMIQHQQNGSQMRSHIHSFQRDYCLFTEIAHGKRRKLEKNQVKCKSIQEFSDVFHSVLFCPEDLTLVRGAPVLRRRFLDCAIGQLRPKYNLALNEYKKLYMHKSKILRERSSNLLATLPDFNLRMAQTGAMIVHYRAHFVKRLQETVPSLYLEFTEGKETMDLSYKTVSTISDSLAGEQVIFSQILQHQESHYHAELDSGRVLTGPHKDDILLEVEGKNAKQFASQGQTRSVALAMKLGEREIFFQETGEYPVLFLDDVLSELDKSRQEFILNRIKTGQVFITSCEEQSFQGLEDGFLFQMEEGCVSAQFQRKTEEIEDIPCES